MRKSEHKTLKPRKPLTDIRETLMPRIADLHAKGLDFMEINSRLAYEFINEPWGNPKKIMVCINEYVRQRRQSMLSELQIAIEYEGSTLDNATSALEDFMRPALSNPDDARIVGLVIGHFLWQVKRKILGLPVDNHLCPLFLTRGQGKGKSSFVANLCSPLRRFGALFYAVSDFKHLTSDQSWPWLLSHYVVNLDEMAKIRGADSGTLKQVISAETLSPRMLHTHYHQECKNNATFIGSANAAVMEEIVFDPSGNRRFYPIEVNTFCETPCNVDQASPLSTVLPKTEFLYPKVWDATPLWKLINPNWPCFVSLEEIAAKQEEHRALTAVEDFVWTCEIRAQSENKGGTWYSTRVLRAACSRHAGEAGKQYTGSDKAFSREFSKVIGSEGRSGGPQRNLRGFEISANFDALRNLLPSP